MKKISEGKKMFLSVFVIFIVYAIIFIIFEDYDRIYLQPFEEASDWHLLIFTIIVMGILSVILYRYAHKMDQRISREQAEKENKMRRELTQNIAHELKTPVASILGYTDTILENPDIDAEMKNRFIEKTNAQAKRLTRLLTDISTLNRMDYAQEMIAMNKIDVNEIVNEVANDAALAMKKRNMTFNNYMPSSVFITGNYSLIYSLFRNLFDNAINYAGNNALIELSAYEKHRQWFFSFSDNGQGVKDKHLDRLFERFYRIDKGRSREIGGTGLGLAIVKNAVILHGGNISASKNSPHGLRFNFTLNR